MSRRLRLVLVATLVAALAVAAVPGATLAAIAGQILFAPTADGAPTTFLVLGSDAGPPPRSGDPRSSNADAFHLLTVSADRRHATLVNIPRDAWVPVPGRGNARINSCLFSGPEACVSTVESVFDVGVDHYALTTMDAVVTAFHTFRVEVDVDRPLSDGGANISEAGHQELTGSQALTFARDRKSRSDGDFERSAAQADLLRAAHRKLIERGDIREVTNAVALLRRHTLTDIPPGQLLSYAFTALSLPPENVDSVTVPGRLGFAGPAAVVFLDDAAYAQVRDATDDGRIQR